MSGIVECPHCYSRVIVKDDLLCPACHKDITLTRTGKRDAIRLEIRQKDRLPRICIVCGESTEYSAIISRKIPEGENPGNSQSPEALRGDGMGNQGIGSMVLALKIPICYACQETQGIQPEAVDSERHSMTFLVHKKFRDMYLRF